MLPIDYLCVACSKEKLITKPFLTKIVAEFSTFLQRIHGDICGFIHPSKKVVQDKHNLLSMVIEGKGTCKRANEMVTDFKFSFFFYLFS